MTSENNELDTTATETKPSEYVKDLLKEKTSLSPDDHPHAMRLIDDEVSKAQSQAQAGKNYRPDLKFVDIYKEKPIKVSAKVLVPVKEHPRFNFVGKLLGPKGNSLKRLQEETMTKMAILGRGSMKDKAKEEELRNSLDPKYTHLCDELHVEIQALAPPAEAYARIAFALAEIRKYMVPDGNDEIRQEQFREIQQFSGQPPRGPIGRGVISGGPPMRAPAPNRPPSAGRGMPPRAPIIPPPRPAPPMAPVSRNPPGKTKVLSILDRARAAMEEGPYQQSPNFEESSYFDQPPATVGYPPSYGSNYNNGSNYFDGHGHGSGYNNSGGEASGNWKTYGNQNAEGGSPGGKMQGSGSSSRYGGGRQAPYSRGK